ncbi:SDR family oxidoreductase [Candidatus Woesearchaeota archaeon]|jgi:uncharacterized protein|nr:SDR family oxidoreductase [Candidatus Woesearchaeota archaeon]
MRFKQKFKKETVLITGASSGIGLELAKIYAKNNHDLVIVSRNKLKLNEICKELKKQNNINCHIISADLSKTQEITQLHQKIKRQKLPISILINNAGFGTYGLFHQTKLEKELNLIDLNIKGLTHLTKLFTQDFLKKKRGRILNVASMAAFQPGPYMAVYYASKAYVLNFSEGIAAELENTQVQISTLCPGATKSGFQKASHSERAGVMQQKIMSARTVAKYAYKKFMKKKATRIIIPGFKNKLMAIGSKLTPRKMITRIIKKLQKPTNKIKNKFN